mmetsp:Transcript_26073/g.37019  ORF Transcript_26073/g.37019 Transcript_26073/m.37019 type:complete len:217 (+) Transcript_26073:824-1474(+)
MRRFRQAFDSLQHGCNVVGAQTIGPCTHRGTRFGNRRTVVICVVLRLDNVWEESQQDMPAVRDVTRTQAADHPQEHGVDVVLLLFEMAVGFLHFLPSSFPSSRYCCLFFFDVVEGAQLGVDLCQELFYSIGLLTRLFRFSLRSSSSSSSSVAACAQEEEGGHCIPHLLVWVLQPARLLPQLVDNPVADSLRAPAALRQQREHELELSGDNGRPRRV